MDQQKLFEQMERQGMNTQEALGRFMGNKPLFLSFVRQLPDKLDLTRIRQALDCAQAILVEYRGNKFKNKKKLLTLLREAETESKAMADLINQYLAEEALV